MPCKSKSLERVVVWKKAEQMFNEIGLYLEENPPFEDWVVYSDTHSPLGMSIGFDKTFNHWSANGTITIKMHKAITQQMKEMGWLE